jgi:hypothetical protein
MFRILNENVIVFKPACGPITYPNTNVLINYDNNINHTAVYCSNEQQSSQQCSTCNVHCVYHHVDTILNELGQVSTMAQGHLTYT